MRRLTRAAAPLAVASILALLAAAPASASFGLKNLGFALENEDGSAAIKAGEHPFAATTTFDANSHTDPELGEVPDDSVKDLLIHPPLGLVANPTAIPPCSNEDFTARNEGASGCPDSTALGVTELSVGFEQPEFFRAPVFNLVPPPGVAAKIGFVVLNVPVTIDLGISQEPPYGPVVEVTNVAQPIRFYGSETEIWGNPASPVHDEERGECLKPSVEDCSVLLPEKPFLTSPRSCSGPLQTTFRTRSWQDPTTWLEYPIQSAFGMAGCSKLPFAPRIDATPTTTQAESPTGLKFDLQIDDEGLTSPDGIAGSDIKKAVVELPEGVTANPSLAEGLGACSEADLDRESLLSAPGHGCPQSSKVGEVEVESPLLEGKITRGEVFIATPKANPFDTLIALYIVLREPQAGIFVTLAGKVTPDPETGQLITTIEDAPQLPVSDFRFSFREGARAPLITPPRCGTYTTKATFTPWANQGSPFTTTSSFEVTSGPNGEPCPQGNPPFRPGFQAGALNNNAGSYSPFNMRLTRRDGDQDLTRFSATLPPGMIAKLAGTTQCSEAAIAATKTKSGKAELASPSCPESAKIGTTLSGAGVGSQLIYVPGSLYMAGPFAGAPLSVVAVVPAVAGPFDVGTVVVREALRIDPRTAEVSVDGGASDPIPHILAGIPLKVRDVRVYVDRPQFTLNPTSCDPYAVGAQLWGGGTNVFSTADDSPTSLSQRFQAAGCAALGFKPGLELKLIGGTKRGGHPALRGTYRPRAGDANLSDVVLRLPRSAFLDQAHIRTICTRVQFAAKSCPPGAVYGHARAFTPLLEQPLEGPVYLRSSNHNLPDFVADLRGIIDVEAVARIDSQKGGIRATFSDVPDAPLSKVVVNMQGAKKGLIINSTDLCASKHRAKASFAGHNGKAHKARPVVRARCGGK
ncbi:MAG TPA: hypothetical protein VIS95_01490 [Solirubrobacterales bacterium]